MPIVTVSVGADGPVVLLAVGVSEPRLRAMEAAGQTPPMPQIVRGLIDTGATCSAVDPSIIQHLGLIPTGSTQIRTPSTGAAPHACNQYDVSLVMLMEPAQMHVISLTVPIIETHLNFQGIRALIGRDVLSQGALFYNGQAQTLSVGY